MQLLTPFPLLQLASYQYIHMSLCLYQPRTARFFAAELLVGEQEAKFSVASSTAPCLARGLLWQKAPKHISRNTKLKGDVSSQPVCFGLSGISPIVLHRGLLTPP